jgi:hypothetical protein
MAKKGTYNTGELDSEQSCGSIQDTSSGGFVGLEGISSNKNKGGAWLDIINEKFITINLNDVDLPVSMMSAV